VNARRWTRACLGIRGGLVLVDCRLLLVEAKRRAVVHELTLIQSLIAAVTGEVGESRVHVVRLHVGRHACASCHALRFCFQICVRGTPLEGAKLEIVETAGDELRVEEVEVS
jgi:hydrogenase nickel incorporation protein HypA/HybF